MKAGIFAAGMGSRFVQAGCIEPKPLICLRGKPLIRHVLDGLFQAGIDEVELLLNAESAFDPVEKYMDRLPEGYRVRTSRKTTRTSYESFRFLTDRLGRPPFLLCTVDTIFPVEALKEFLNVRSYPSECQLVLAATDFVHDEKPLWVEMNAEGKVVGLGEAARTREAVTAGLYLLLKDCMGQAGSGPFRALRGFLGSLVEAGAEVWAKRFPAVLDIDCPDDIRVAESLLTGSRAGCMA
jgi:NDP-sugar pyrophosphorylase family protein